MMLAAEAALLGAAATAAAPSEWTTAQQAGVANVAGVVLSPSGQWAAVQAATLELCTGAGARSAAGAAVAAFCNASACTLPTFAPSAAAGAFCGRARRPRRPSASTSHWKQ